MSGNTVGRLFCVTSFGESHGPAIGCVVDGCPPGLALSEADIQQQLDRRRPGTSRHVTQRQETDTVEILSGVFEGPATGTLLLCDSQCGCAQQGLQQYQDTFRPGMPTMPHWRYGIRDIAAVTSWQRADREEVGSLPEL
jgi:chorismate synthase